MVLGNAYNSMNLGAGSRFPAGSTGYGWRFSAGPDISIAGPSGSTFGVTYFGPAGEVDLFKSTTGWPARTAVSTGASTP